MTQNLDSTKYGSEESLTKVLDVARFTKVVDNEGNVSTVAGECVMACPQTGALAALQVPPQNLLGLCYLGTEGVRDTGRHYRDQKVRVIQF